MSRDVKITEHEKMRALAKGTREERLEHLVELLGGPKRVAELLGVSRTTLHNWLKKEARLPFDVGEALASAAGVTLDWIATGRDRYDPVQPFTPVPRFDISPSGMLVEVDGMFTTPLGLRKDWLDDLGIKPKEASLVAMRGDAMAPTLKDGTLLVIDRGWKAVRGDGIYAFSTGGGFVVRRAQAMVDGSLQISADNPAYQPQTVPAAGRAALHIEGRVRAALVTL